MFRVHCGNCYLFLISSAYRSEELKAIMSQSKVPPIEYKSIDCYY